MTLRALYDLPAPAKLNAFLHVVGRRPDGYHLLQSAFVLIDWADTLHFERRPVKTGRQVVTLVVADKPVWVGVDPYNKRIDRNSDDNLARIDSD